MMPKVSTKKYLDWNPENEIGPWPIPHTQGTNFDVLACRSAGHGATGRDWDYHLEPNRRDKPQTFLLSP